MRLVVLSTLIAIVAGGAFAADAPPCRAHDMGRALDFWLGDWRVTSMDGKTVYGENHVTADLGGCAIHEDWTAASGGKGKSLFFFDAREGRWEQIWVTADTARPGGLKHKRLIARLADGGVRFQAELTGAGGGSYLDRTTLTPQADGSVRQLIEVSTDAGATWRAVFDSLYRRAQ